MIGPSAPSLAAQLAKPRLKQKPNFGGRGGKTKRFFFSNVYFSQRFVLLESCDLLSMRLHDRITSNSSIGRRLHQTLKQVCSVYEQTEIWQQKLFHLEYPFAKYNIQPTTYTFMQDKYSHFLEGEIVLTRVLISFHCFFFLSTDKEWTKEETDYLFSVVRDFDLRWYHYP